MKTNPKLRAITFWIIILIYIITGLILSSCSSQRKCPTYSKKFGTIENKF